jgi:hypothetical protein
VHHRQHGVSPPSRQQVGDLAGSLNGPLEAKRRFGIPNLMIDEAVRR